MGEWFLMYQRNITKHSQCHILEDQDPLLQCCDNFKTCKLKYTHTLNQDATPDNPLRFSIMIFRKHCLCNYKSPFIMSQKRLENKYKL